MTEQYCAECMYTGKKLYQTVKTTYDKLHRLKEKSTNASQCLKQAL